MKLAQLYEQFHDGILKNDAAIALALKAHPRLSAEQQLAIYHDGYRSRLLRILRETYEATRAAMDEGAFDAQARTYIEQTPPTHFNIDRYAIGFEKSLQAEPFTHELAQLESTIAETFWEKESAALEASALKHLDEAAFAALRLSLRKAARVLQFEYPIHDWLTAFRRGEQLPLPAPSQNYLLVVRHTTKVQYYPLTQQAYDLLTRLANGMTIAKALTQSQVDVHTLQSCFAEWLTQGVFQRVQQTVPPAA